MLEFSLALQGFLGVAFMVEGLLFAFHLKGTALDWKLHLLLVLVVFCVSLACFAEIANPNSLLLTTVRAQLTLLQGLWFYQIAQILFRGKPACFLSRLCAAAGLKDAGVVLRLHCCCADNPAWDPTTHGSVMMIPFFFVLWVLVVALTTLAGEKLRPLMFGIETDKHRFEVVRS